MISYIKGSLEAVADGYILLETGGIGYRVFVSGSTIEKLPEIGEKTKIFTFMNVKEDEVSLFGFYSMEELNMFNMLITVSGVGPKGALGFLNMFDPSEIMMAIISDDITTLSKVPGIGKKTAQRIVLELNDKFKNQDFLDSISVNVTEKYVSVTGTKSEAIEALSALGYSRSEAAKTVNAVYDDSLSVEELLKHALKKMIN